MLSCRWPFSQPQYSLHLSGQNIMWCTILPIVWKVSCNSAHSSQWKNNEWVALWATCLKAASPRSQAEVSPPPAPATRNYFNLNFRGKTSSFRNYVFYYKFWVMVPAQLKRYVVLTALHSKGYCDTLNIFTPIYYYLIQFFFGSHSMQPKHQRVLWHLE